MPGKESKRCPRCAKTKPLTEWSRDRARYDGLRSYCKECNSAYAREWYSRRDVREAKSLAAAEKYQNMSPEEKAEYTRKNTEHRRKSGYHLKKYGMTIEAYDKLLKKQGYVCAICGNPPKRNRLSVDHDHACCPGQRTCGKCTRGLLCMTCNVWLGYFEDKKWTESASNYLKERGNNG